VETAQAAATNIVTDWIAEKKMTGNLEINIIKS